MIEIVLLAVICVLLAILAVLQFLFRSKIKAEDLDELKKISNLEVKLESMMSYFREDFRMSRQETANSLKQGVAELANQLKEFKVETSYVMKETTNLSQESLKQINQTLEGKLSDLVKKIDENNRTNREELTRNLRDSMADQKSHFETFDVSQKDTFMAFQKAFDKNVESFNSLQREKFSQLEIKQTEMINNTEAKLNLIKSTVEEKLEKTLSERIGQSFETVGKQLIEVQKGLGEMQTLAQDVGGLKKVLSNVKMRGGLGETQLEMLLENLLAPDQYEKNVKTKTDSKDLVEFAIKLPGQSEAQDSYIWLPIDAKFPKDVYEQLQTAHDSADLVKIESAQKNLETTIKSMAKDISAKYIDPPNTTDFAIMFLPFEGIFAEVVRKASLLEELQKQFKVIVTGPTTLAAILNSLQMGFKTLAIEKRSSEVWTTLGLVKKEFESFGGLLSKAQTNIKTGLSQLDDVMGKRTRAIQRQLRSVESLEPAAVDGLRPLVENLGNILTDSEE